MTELIEHSKNLNVCMCGCGQLCKKKYIRGHNRSHWKGGKYIDNEGYIKIYVNNEQIREHRAIYKHYLKILFDEDIEIPSNVDIHHIDHNKQNNSLINLEAVYEKEHIHKYHINQKRSRNEKKPPIQIIYIIQ